VIVGAGYIGLEVAAAATALGCDVVVLEAMDRVMSRVTSEPVSQCFERLHRDHGTRFVFGAAVAEVRRTGSALEVVTADGARHAADLVVVGIGILPNQELAAAAGLEHSDGIHVDADARTSDPHIYAIGDITRFTCRRESVSLRLECVQNALDQAEAAVRHLTGRPAADPPIPWFWTVQHDVRLQAAGIRDPGDEVVVRSHAEQGRFSVLYVRDGRLAAIDTVNALRDFTAGKKLIAARAQIDRVRAADPSLSLTDAVVVAV
jgi:3-phenylpropionate/trans-cinnamate dioxygenase ferredoxin reductase subunit